MQGRNGGNKIKLAALALALIAFAGAAQGNVGGFRGVTSTIQAKKDN